MDMTLEPMPFFWICIILTLLIVIAVDWSHFRQLMGPGWVWWSEFRTEPYKTDFQIRAEHRETICGHILTVSASDPLSYHDTHLEHLLAREMFDEARKHCMHMIMLARQHRDPDQLRTYSIYRQRIAGSQNEADRQSRLRIREFLKTRKKRPKVIVEEATIDDRTSPPPSKKEETERIGFLEMPSSAIRLRPPLKPAESESRARNDDQDNYEELIEI